MLSMAVTVNMFFSKLRQFNVLHWEFEIWQVIFVLLTILLNLTNLRISRWSRAVCFQLHNRHIAGSSSLMSVVIACSLFAYPRAS